ncbi:MAG: BamA/TamA family outer membrane protein [Gammaproteobacteria bacterium]|nr:BamA/TamA family outer membrane protein [Gammaproteobacteria bacterium]
MTAIKHRLLCAVFVILMMFCGQLLASIVTQIEFVGNEKTRDYILKQEMQTKIGNELDMALLKDDLQAIMNLGIFRDVDYYLYAADDNVQGHVKLIVVVREKYYMVVIPEIRFDEADKAFRLGILGYWDNIFGSNQRLHLKTREFGGILGVDDIRHELTYEIPRLYGSAFNFTVFGHLREAAIVEANVDAQARKEKKYGFDVLRWRHLKNRSSGWYMGAGLYHEERNNEALVAGDVSEPDYQGKFWGLRVGYKKVDEYLFNRRGKDFGYTIDTTRLLFDAEQNHTKHLLFYKGYYRLKSSPLNNLNARVELGVSEGEYLGDTEFYLGGSELRGYIKNYYSGNVRVLMNLEYLKPFTNNPSYRYGMLFDLGNTYDSFDEIELAHLHPAIGVAFRWKLAAFVNVNLRMDIGYAIDTGDSNVLINSRHLF